MLNHPYNANNTATNDKKVARFHTNLITALSAVAVLHANHVALSGQKLRAILNSFCASKTTQTEVYKEFFTIFFIY
jgi:hypothetical protein